MRQPMPHGSRYDGGQLKQNDDLPQQPRLMRPTGRLIGMQDRRSIRSIHRSLAFSRSP